MSPHSPSRRALLLSGAGTLSLSVLAGCISDLDDDSSPDDAESTAADDEGSSTPDESNDGDGGDKDGDDLESDDDDEATTETNDDPEYELEHYQHLATGDEADVSLLTDHDDLETWLADRMLEEDLESLLDDVNFSAETLVALEVDAPTPCYKLELDRLAIADDSDDESDGDKTLELEASVHETGDDMCSQVITTIGVLVRVSVASDRIAGLSAGIVDTDGSEYGMGTTSVSDDVTTDESGDEAGGANSTDN
ncbi:hypothetical protein G6M89_21455 [Natronolimnobius sp. AArcel1]|uniref:hypothetical protein n=1 Tax=Natronolimnobius sp. AArcel1 TaxID=1679093 RepID=UPI0013EBEFF2|nr:hypothetical protein [Natronolimnobius sp. AArcel1]NGM71516.1 hypothetical protein [Natronolimnobius sp. AArcel1]